MDDSTDRELHLGPWLAGAAIGAAVMYMLDPERGGPRRAQSARALRTLSHRAGASIGKAAHGLGERATVARDAVRTVGKEAAGAGAALRGAVADAAEAIRGGAAAARDTAQEGLNKAGARLADEVSDAARRAAPDSEDRHTPSDASDGAASALGSAAASIPSALREAGRLAADAGGRLAADVGSRLGAGPGGGSGPDSGAQAAALAGSALGLYGLVARRSPLGFVAGLAGLALLASSARATHARSTGTHAGDSRSHPLRSLLGAANPARPVIIQKTIRIDAPVEQVFEQFADYENFPRFMSNVVEVRDLGERRSHWIVKGPAGTRFHWNARLTESTRPRRLAWESEPDAEVEQAGAIVFEPFRSGTRVTVHLSYRPPAGAVGHALAALLGSDPKRQMDDDLARMKALVERRAAAYQTRAHEAARGEASPGALLH